MLYMLVEHMPPVYQIVVTVEFIELWEAKTRQPMYLRRAVIVLQMYTNHQRLAYDQITIICYLQLWYR